MSYILSVYSKQAFKECLLPAINNADYRLNIQKELFGLMEEQEIPMEIIDGKWRFEQMSNVRLYYTATKKEYFGEVIKDEDVFSFVTNCGEQISIIVRETDKSFSVYEKFELSNVDEITFGKGEENTFSYDCLSLISKRHGRIVRKGNYFILEDMSSNGIFVNSKRVFGSWNYNLETASIFLD